MRILLANWTVRRVGGAETYLDRVMPLLAARSHPLAFAFETDEPADRASVALPGGCMPVPLTSGDAFDRIRRWDPDVVYVHGLLNPDLERRLLEVAPAVLFAHGYYGTCISGQKTHRLPFVQPCDRVFGAACLALFYPRRCGGLSPVTMGREYARQGARNALLRQYAAVMTHSGHMSREFTRHAAAGGRVIHSTYLRSDSELVPVPSRLRAARPPADPWHLVFIGRMDHLKGGGYLLDALHETRTALGEPIRVTFAGDGPARGRWQRRAARVAAANPGISVQFTGWLPRREVIGLLDTADVVVVPSVWPEPYGLVGPEAGRRGVPAVAFDTGGISEWLIEGVNGCLAPGKRPDAAGLAGALIRCLRGLRSSDALRFGALSSVKDEDDNRHVDALLTILEDAASRRPRGAPGATR
jgi:glycosyltransferase involved in cell wall biosynthesis